MFKKGLALTVCLLGWMVGIAIADETANAVMPVVKVTHPQAAPLVYPHRLTGVVVPLSQAQVGFQVAGRVAERLVRIGQPVEAGQLLMRLDDRDYRLQVAQVEAEIRATESDYETAQRDLQRYQDLLKRNLASQQQVDSAQNAVTKLKAQLAALKPKLAQVKNQLAYTRLYAPEAGTVQAYLAETGQVVGAGVPVVQLVYRKGQAVEINWPETWGAVAKTVQVTLHGQSYEATLYEAAAVAEAASRTLKVRYRLPEHAPRMWGRTAQVASRVEGETFWKVPLSALQMEHGQAFVLIVENGILKQRPVTLLRMGDQSAWVQGELSAQLQIVGMGVHVLRPGLQVRVVKDE